ncbi:MAG: aldehyde dehydrogenase family protein [Daejeonella sp.]
MKNRIKEVFDAQKAQSILLRSSDASQRKSKLEKLKTVIESYEKEIFAALHKDLRKSEFESAFSEVYFTYGELDFAIKNVSSWMKPKKVSANMLGFFTKNRIYYEPKGTCLIIAPWNYPFQLLMSPLISAIAAGNTAILKPSEISPATSSVIMKMISENFAQEEIACFEGDAEVSKALLELPFDHIFFTGGTNIGKIVMAAAAKNLTSVTLELGGKSPVVIAENTNLKNAAHKIVWGKFMNAGQTCIAPDYILIRKEQEDEFVKYASGFIEEMYKTEGKIDKQSYGKIINQKNFERLNLLMEDAVKNGASVVAGGKTDGRDLTIEPTLMSNVKPESDLMQEEIFGPVLPLINYEDIDDAISFINKRDKPLALYVFSDKSSITDRVIKNTSAGGTCVNDVLVHISNPNLPFGGVNSSGMGSCHGFFGFKTFSHERAVVFQSAIDFNKMIYPPFGNKSGLLKWLKKLM